VCRRLLPGHDAEDAFQATFLTLARKAGSIGKHESVSGWLYTVASRIA
jgi:RNA polymerase sigma-70 factor (ECF subfamily)